MTTQGTRTTAGRGRLYDSILDTVGDTPVIRVNNLAPQGVDLYVKAEFFNPAASVKDRLALNIIEAAERSGALQPGQTVVEATSGNTGIGLAMVCAQKGYPLVVTMADSFSVERRRLMRLLGAKVVLTPRADKGTGMYNKAVELAREHGWFLARQFETAANADIHEATTAREILGDFAGRRLDCVVTGYGTGGTVTGAGEVLKQRKPGIHVVAVEPAESPVLSGGEPSPHPIQGLGAGFVPAILDTDVYDEVIRVDARTAAAATRRLARTEGILGGISSGAALAAGEELARRDEFAGKVVVVVLPDTGERYLSTDLFEER